MMLVRGLLVLLRAAAFGLKSIRSLSIEPFSIVLVSISLLLLPQHLVSQSPASRRVAAIYKDGILSLTIPYRTARTGAGRLQVELLNPEDRVLAKADRHFDLAEGNGSIQQYLIPKEAIDIDDLVWLRLHYRFIYDDEQSAGVEETRSLSEILRKPVVHILGQQSYLSGGKAAIRLLVTDANDHAALGNGAVRIELLMEKRKAVELYRGSLTRRGTTDAQFQLPADLAGSYQLHFIVDTPIGLAEYTQEIQLQQKASILLTTEKPVYQPGQTIHIRALALDRANHHSIQGRALTFEVEDARGNKVFKKITTTDDFGIASAEFQLADEVNLGTYHLRALLNDAHGAASDSAEIALNVQRYVLPKFKVAIDFTEKDHKPRRDYRPGDHVTGVIHANYFFGKPVSGAEISLKASSMDVSVFEASTTNGKTDQDGSYHFELKLPDYFAAKPLTHGAARVLVEATVKDLTEHSETRGEPITVSRSSLLITAIPEGGSLIPHLVNEVFVLASYADGSPAVAHLNLHLEGDRDQQTTTDKGGVALVRIKPASGTSSLHVEADDHRGNRALSDIELESRDGQDQILLRTERGVYRTGDPIALEIFSTKERGSAYIDILKDGQTILTRDIDIENGHASVAITATPEMAGTLDLDAYLFGRDARPVGDHRLIFVQPADELKIETVADARVYKPGAEANVHFHVTNDHGDGVRAAIGVQVVDEAVFALAEKHPGFAKVFFYLEQEAMKPRYEIHSISMSDVVEPVSAPVSRSDLEEQNRAARALFAATEIVNSNQLQTQFGQSPSMVKYAEYSQRYQAAFLDYLRRLASQLSESNLRYGSSVRSEAALMSAFEKLGEPDGSKPRDAWGTPLQMRPIGWMRGPNRYFQIQSAGPDGLFNTGDDLQAYFETHVAKVTANATFSSGDSSKIGVEIDSGRGPFNGRANIAGSVEDLSGAMVAGAKVELNSASGNSHRAAACGADGRFTISAIEPGKYEIKITAPGFLGVTEALEVRARDVVDLSATLSIGAVSETVTVTAEASMPVPQPMRMAKGGAAFRPGGMAAANGMMMRERAFDTLTINSATLQDLPLNGRDVSEMMALTSGAANAGSEPAHVRSYFPEALYINPEIVTDGHGDASITIPIADSITTWRMAMLASTQLGALGSGSSSLKVFQDFFADLDLPVTLTQGDRVSIPVAVYNYSGERGEVTLKLEPDDWFSMVDDASEKSLVVKSDHPGGSQFTIQAKHIGKFKLTLSARLNGSEKREDIVVREVEVVPNGREQSIVYNGHLDTNVQHQVDLPANAIPEASKIFVRLYPGPLSQIMEGMDSILSMPGGCFEQTSSSTYPNVLALDYMKRTKKLTPEVHARAEGYIANGYQRLLTFEVPGGGFSWFGQAPANKILTAYGLMEFSDMSKVYDVDPRLIERTQQWLVAQQQPDGSWKPDASFINEGATNRFNSDVLRITAYLAWSLVKTGYKGPAVEKAKDFIVRNLDGKQSHPNGKADTYTLAVLANFAVEYGKDREFTAHVMKLLIESGAQTGEQISWNPEETGVYSTGTSAAIETTGLAAQALLRWGQAAPTVRKALNFITAKKDATGGWGTTQATIMALRAVVLASEIGTSDVRGRVEISLNGKPAQSLELTPQNNDLLHQFVFKSAELQASNSVEIRFYGTGGLAYQVSGSYFVPWEDKREGAAEPLSINVVYDRTTLAQDDIAAATATIKSNLGKRANMVMVDLGIPPGFELLSEDLQQFQEKSAGRASGHLEKFSLTATQAILYLDALAPHEILTLKFRLRAKYPIRAHSFESRVYEYYDPEVTASARPVELEVTGH